MKQDELLDCIEQWAERMSNAKAATMIPVPPQIHVQGLVSSLSITLNEMFAVLKQNEREIPMGEV